MVNSALTLDSAREEAELSDYLGESYDRRKLERYQQTLDDEFATSESERDFYRSSEAYLYNLTAFAMTRTKLPYLEELTKRLASGARVLDYGCGIGSDGLLLLEAGYQVEFADFDNPSTKYLRWRLGQRGFDAPVHDLDDRVPGDFDAAFAFDVIEHVADPFEFLAQMEQRARMVEVNFLEPEPDDQALHHKLPIKPLVRHAARQELLLYRVLHDRSHLVLYCPGQTSRVERLTSFLRWNRGRIAALKRPYR